MKSIVIISAVIFSFLFFSCERKSGNIIGQFEVIKKVHGYSIKDDDLGHIYCVSSLGDTARVFVSSSEDYLNIAVGQKIFLSSHEHFGVILTNHVKRFNIGYCQIVKKNPTTTIDVLTKGGDTIRVKPSSLIFYNTEVGDSVFVKKQRKTPSYYIE